MQNQQQKIEQVKIQANARLHLGFFDLNGALGRKFGSIGIALAQPTTQLVMQKSETIQATGAESARAESILNTIIEKLNLSAAQGAHMQIQQAIPAHAGLGSGTQLALAVGMAYSKLYDLNLQPAQVAQLTARGARSGIGIGTFMQGGVVVDGGRSAHTLTPPIIARADFPEDWRIILVMDASHQGVHGEQEIHAFNQLQPAANHQAEKLCRHVLMQALPALAEQDLASFGAAVRELQMATGDYFAPMQGGRYASAKVASVLDWFEEQGVTCVGQSSWGPTGFAIVDSQEKAQSFVNSLNTHFAFDQALSFIVTQAQHQGTIC